MIRIHVEGELRIEHGWFYVYEEFAAGYGQGYQGKSKRFNLNGYGVFPQYTLRDYVNRSGSFRVCFSLVTVKGFFHMVKYVFNGGCVHLAMELKESAGKALE